MIWEKYLFVVGWANVNHHILSRVVCTHALPLSSPPISLSHFFLYIVAKVLVLVLALGHMINLGGLRLNSMVRGGIMLYALLVIKRFFVERFTYSRMNENIEF